MIIIFSVYTNNKLIRDYNPNTDLNQVIYILKNSFNSLSEKTHWEMKQYVERGLESPLSNWLVIEKEDLLIACTNLRITHRTGYISSFAVHPQYRRQKVGTLLAKESIEFFKKKGCNEIFIYVRPSNIPAKIFYIKLGFTPETLSTNHSHPEKHTIKMVLSLLPEKAHLRFK